MEQHGADEGPGRQADRQPPEPVRAEQPRRDRDVGRSADHPCGGSQHHQVVGAAQRELADREAVVALDPAHAVGRCRSQDEHGEPTAQPCKQRAHRDAGDDDDAKEFEELGTVRRLVVRPPPVDQRVGHGDDRRPREGLSRPGHPASGHVIPASGRVVSASGHVVFRRLGAGWLGRRKCGSVSVGVGGALATKTTHALGLPSLA